MLIFLKPVQGSSPPPATASGTAPPPVLCEEHAPPSVEQRVKRRVWLAVGVVLAASLMAGIYLYGRRPRVPPPTATTAGHASRPATTNKSLLAAAATSGAVCGQALTSQVSAASAVVWTNVHVTAIIGDAQGHYYARVNNLLVTVGDTIRGMTVVGISAESVKFAQGDAEREFPVGGGGE